MLTCLQSFVFGEVLFSLTFTCLCICLRIDYLKHFWPILMKFDRIMYNEKILVAFDDEIKPFIRTEVTAK